MQAAELWWRVLEFFKETILNMYDAMIQAETCFKNKNKKIEPYGDGKV